MIALIEMVALAALSGAYIFSSPAFRQRGQQFVSVAIATDTRRDMSREAGENRTW